MFGRMEEKKFESNLIWFLIYLLHGLKERKKEEEKENMRV